VEEGAIIRDCRGIGRMRVMCEVVIIGYSVSGECGGGKDKERNWRERRRK
jgi:hypothetical protein